MKKSFRNLSLLSVLLLIIGCTSETKLKEQVQKVIKENPNILISAIEEKPTEFVEAFQPLIDSVSGTLLLMDLDGKMYKERVENYKSLYFFHLSKPLFMLTIVLNIKN